MSNPIGKRNPNSLSYWGWVDKGNFGVYYFFLNFCFYGSGSEMTRIKGEARFVGGFALACSALRCTARHSLVPASKPQLTGLFTVRDTFKCNCAALFAFVVSLPVPPSREFLLIPLHGLQPLLLPSISAHVPPHSLTRR